MSAVRAVAAVFANREMRRIQLAWGATSFAMWSFAIALGVFAFDAAGATAVGVAALVRLLPGALASPFAGLIGDRHSRRSVLVASSLGVTVVFAGAATAVALDAPTWLVFALAGALTIASSPYVPAEGALLPVIARTPQELTNANVARSATDNLGFFAGSAVTGVLLALASVEVAIGTAVAFGAGATVLLAGLSPDARPEYADRDAGGVIRETTQGARAMIGDPRVRLVGAALTLLVFFLGAADVLVVIVALDLLDLGDGSVGFLNAAWGVGAIAATAPLALLLDRGRIAAALVVGCLAAGAAMALPAAWVAPFAAYIAWVGVGAGYNFVEVAARTLVQRLGSDETLARVLGSLETLRLAAMAAGAIAVPGLIAASGTRAAMLAIAAVLPLFAIMRWRALRSFELGTAVEERLFALVRGNRIFAPLPVDKLEGIANSLVRLSAAPGQEIITEGDHGGRFYLIESGEVDVFEGTSFQRRQGPGDCFGEIALLHDVARTATVRARSPVALYALDRDQFIAAVTGHRRSRSEAGALIDGRLSEPG